MDISVIVPAYNSEKYIQECINSILNQDYPVKELIIIDDGSTDSTYRICKTFETNDKVKIIHTENKGVSAARNTGLSLSTGDLISFIDADDWIEPNMYSVMIAAMQETGAEIALASYYKHRKDETIVYSLENNRLYTSQKALYEIVRDKTVNSLSPTFLFSRSVLKDLRYPVGRRYFEDTLFIYRALENARYMVHVAMPLYHYRRHDESALGVWPLSVALAFVEAHQDRFNDLSLRHPELKPVMYRSYYRVFSAAKKHLKNSNREDLTREAKKIIKTLRSFYFVHNKDINKIAEIKVFEKISNSLFLFFPRFYRIVSRK